MSLKWVELPILQICGGSELHISQHWGQDWQSLFAKLAKYFRGHGCSELHKSQHWGQD